MNSKSNLNVVCPLQSTQLRAYLEMILKLLLSEPPLPQYQLSKALSKIQLEPMSPKTKTIYYKMCASRRR